MDIGATSAWEVSTGSAEVIVGVVDTGVDYRHPDLAANMWVDPRPGPSFGSHGYNAITGSFDPLDDNRHGTHVAGTIGAAGNNGLGVVGVNWTTRIMALKFLSATNTGTTAHAIEAINYAIQAKLDGINIRILSNSWGGGGFSQALRDTISAANDNGILFVAAAGNATSDNDVTPAYPASYEVANVISVAATNNLDQLASFSNFGLSSVDLGAPGRNILSTVLNGQYAFLSGTSMATPHVSGAAALILATQPNLSVAQLTTVLLNGVDPTPALDGKVLTGGRLNVCQSVSGPNCGALPPSVVLASPANGASFVQGEPILFSGSAIVVEDGDLSAGITWTSSVDGLFGTGASFSLATLGVGTHSILAAAVDSGGTPGSASATITVDPAPLGPPAVNTFSVTPTPITVGETATLSWNTTDADSVTIDNGVGTVALDGSTAVTPAVTTPYALTAVNTLGTATASVTVTVNPAPLPAVDSYSATPSTITAGQSATLSWTTTNADSVSIDGGASLPADGSSTVSPVTTTAYVLTATGPGRSVTARRPGGSVTASVTITVNPVPAVDSFTGAPATITAGQSATLSWTTTNADSVSIDGVGEPARRR